MSNPLVQGRCPSCGSTTLFLGDGGYITCSRKDCSVPDAATLILEDGETQHLVDVGVDSFGIMHPLIERVGGDLFGCRLHEELTALAGPPVPPGRYRVTLTDADPEWTPA